MLYVSFLHRPAGVPPSATDPSDEDGAKAYGSSSLESASLSRKLAAIFDFEFVYRSVAYPEICLGGALLKA